MQLFFSGQLIRPQTRPPQLTIRLGVDGIMRVSSADSSALQSRRIFFFRPNIFSRPVLFLHSEEWITRSLATSTIHLATSPSGRSEERRVGKECRCRWS